MIKVWTDGSCTNNGAYKGIGGWAYHIMSTDNQNTFEHAGGETNTTNNRMEMQAVIEALKQIADLRHLFEDEYEILIYSDSNLIVETLRKGGTWKRKENLDKWFEIDDVIQVLYLIGFDVDFVWVKAHNSQCTKEETQLNKRVDKLATKARDGVKDLLLSDIRL